jgi:SHS2 domain-containing protein
MTDDRGVVCEIDHTADLGFELTASDIPSLFSSAANALYELIADPDGVETREEVTISATCDTREELFHSWLCELLAQFNLNGFIAKHCEIVAVDERHVEARLAGEKLDLTRHRFHTEIKGVTYHAFKVWQEKGSWHARVIFDV